MACLCGRRRQSLCLIGKDLFVGEDLRCPKRQLLGRHKRCFVGAGLNL